MQIFNANPVSPLRAWVHAILPLVYDDSLSYYEVLAKVADKMNEVVTHLNDVQEALHDNDEFLKNSIENLTQSFNNFQQSMLTRQENFETTWNERYENFEQSLTEKENQFESKITEQQTAFESKINSDFSTLSAQLDGDIANWEADVQEGLTTWQGEQEQKEQTFETNMEQKFTDFLENYQKTFGVLQTLVGDSTTDTVSQNAINKSAYFYRGTFNTAHVSDCNDLKEPGVQFVYYNSNNTNYPVPTTPYSTPFGGFVFTIENSQHESNNFITQIAVHYDINKQVKTDCPTPIFTRTYQQSAVGWTEWVQIYPSTTEEFPGDSITKSVSQKLASELGMFYKTTYRSGTTVDCNDLKENGLYYIYFGNTKSNFPEINDTDFGTEFGGIVITMNNAKYYLGDVEKGFINQFAIAFPIAPGYQNGNIVRIFYRLYHKPFLVGEVWSEWKQIYPIPNVLTKSDVLTTLAGSDISSPVSQHALNETAFFYRGTYNTATECDLNDFKKQGATFVYYHASNKNLPVLPEPWKNPFGGFVFVIDNHTYSPNQHFVTQYAVHYEANPDMRANYPTPIFMRTFFKEPTTEFWSDWVMVYPYTNQKRVMFMGDSITTFGVYNPEGYADFYPNNQLSRVSDTWWYQVVQNMNYKLERNNSWSGSTICGTADSTFIKRAINDPSLFKNVEYIYIFGGTNDADVGLTEGNVTYSDYDDTQIVPAFCHLLEIINNSKSKLCKVVNLCGNKLGTTLKQKMGEACTHYGFTNIILNEYDKADKLHPSVTGHAQIASQITLAKV